MKICPRHVNDFRNKLALFGMGQALRSETYPPGDGPLGNGLAVLCAEVARNFPVAAMNAPADMCPFCKNPELEPWIEKAAHNMAYIYPEDVRLGRG